ncbi:ABC transporter ATP-binding protein [Stappia sp.]|jgi:iron complex transport system ATP-binding protein|uniref:ABC transporter ATP-binding protein n=1 Tax=Stappia sp. TaxID=1870903 RepID=UPI003A9A560D
MTHESGLETTLELIGVGYSTARGQRLVEDVSFHVHAGEILVIAGPNGAGKSTLVRMIAGLAPAGDGEILLGKRSLARVPIHERARAIAYVGQSEEPDGRLSVADYVALGRLPHRRALDARAHQAALGEALAVAGLTGLSRRTMGSLSGGERQRAKIARAVCQEPRLLVLDEPTNHLDPRARGDLLSLVTRLGITVIAVLHDLTLIEDFASHVALIDEGRLTAYGHPRDVLSSARVRATFEVDMHRLPHPSEDRMLCALDIPIRRTTPEAVPALAD